MINNITYLSFQLADTEKILYRNAIFLGFSLLYLPQLLLALMTTLDTKASSLTILWNHPSLIMLPLFTFFTFSKPHNFCRKDPSDNRVMFSVKYTKINMAMSIASYLLFCYVMRFTMLTKSEVFQDFYSIFYNSISYLFTASIILTMTFVYFDHLFCCCCQCFLSSKHQIVVHDPNNPDRTFHLVNGEIIEVREKAEGLRGIFIEMNIRDAVTSFADNLDLATAEPSGVTAIRSEIKTEVGSKLWLKLKYNFFLKSIPGRVERS